MEQLELMHQNQPIDPLNRLVYRVSGIHGSVDKNNLVYR
jgi:hypothetical protein